MSGAATARHWGLIPSRRRYAAFVQVGIGQSAPWGNLKGQILLGSEALIEKMVPQLEASVTVAEIPTQQRRLHRHSLKDLLLAGVDSKAGRNRAIARAYLEHGYTLAEIGREVG